MRNADLGRLGYRDGRHDARFGTSHRKLMVRSSHVWTNADEQQRRLYEWGYSQGQNDHALSQRNG